MKIDPKDLKKFVLDAGLISKQQFEKVQKKAKTKKKDIETILLEDGLMDQEDLSKLNAYILGIPFVSLKKEIIDSEILKIIPEPIARKHNIIAFRKDGTNLEVAMLDPEDLRTIDFIKKKIGLKICPRLTSPDSIKKVLMQYHETLEAEFGNIIKKESGGIRQIKEKSEDDEKNLRKVAKELPVIKIVDTLLKHAVLQRASDIHIEPTEKEVIVRYRIDGILHDAMVLPKLVRAGIVARIKVLSDLKLDEHRLPQDGRFKIETGEFKYSIRVSILPTFAGEKIVMRLLSETSRAFTLEVLGFSGDTLEDLQHNLKKPVGMILVTGPTGSGKTTTLYSMLDILNTPEVNISTVEDPIEYRMQRINQTQTNAKIGLTFASGLRSLVRQDPDIIMVGEIRDTETSSLAINAALTGHLVLSTLHTTDAAGAIPRLIDMKAEPFLISSTLNVIIAQRLVRRLCSNSEKYTLKDSEIKDLSKSCDLEKVLDVLRKEKVVKANATFKDISFYKPVTSKGCEDGYKGRVGIYEVLNVTETIKELIVKRATSDEIQARAQQEGMRTMMEDGFIKAAQGQTTIEEVLRVIME
ncbi:Flp pilus assembly complex ATPase component TadA [Patescibacteria group bacterium]|nr:Flp pilus assembly complex ATPase component TadA [Patescibacteria group bacterium]